MKVVGIKKATSIHSKSLKIQKSCYSKIKNGGGYIVYLSTAEQKDKKEEDFIEDILSYYTEDHENTINRLERQMIDCQETTRNLVSKYIIELETERGKVRKLNDIIDQQDKKIRSIKANQKEKSVKKLMYEQDEYCNNNSNDELLNVLVELQTIELIEKKKMIIELRQERKELLKKVHLLNGISMRESIDSTTTTCSSSSSSSSSINILENISSGTIITPPSSPPPKYPIPPIPRKNKNRKKHDKESSFTKKLNTASFLIKSWKRRSTAVS
ncbi:hypothetical protein BD770DRAFT_396801 [Pilaira anomala]|nr:hypothetical protein BD770DRAFT_396801 [Pilaira anomala]